jgi:hypothetical protein
MATVNDASLSPRITEDPRFLSLQGYVAANQAPPKLDDARRLFQHAMSMKGEPEIKHLRSWFFAELKSGYGSQECLRISELARSPRREAD